MQARQHRIVQYVILCIDALFAVLYSVFFWSEDMWLLSVKTIQRQRLYKEVAEIRLQRVARDTASSKRCFQRVTG